MRCLSCGAEVNGAFCEYCGTKMPVERVETMTVNADNVIMNNYCFPGQSRGGAVSDNASGNDGGERADRLSSVSPKSRLAALLLCVFFGWLGAHRFYAGRYVIGVVYLLTLGLFGFGWLVDVALIAVGKMRDRSGLEIVNWSER